MTNITNMEILRAKAQIENFINNSRLPPVVQEGVLAEVLADVRALVCQELSQEVFALQNQVSQMAENMNETKEEDDGNIERNSNAEGPRG